MIKELISAIEDYNEKLTEFRRKATDYKNYDMENAGWRWKKEITDAEERIERIFNEAVDVRIKTIIKAMRGGLT